MLLIAVLRRSWEGVLAVLPRALLNWLDAWARGAAEKRVERRRRLMPRR